MKTAIPSIREDQFQQQIIKLARTLGWKIAHFRPAMTANGWRTAVSGDGKGFPDCVLVKGSRLVIAELKTDSPKSQTSPEQNAWLEAFGGTKCEVYIWRPRHWDEIVEILSGCEVLK
ncbi:MAG: hypothetical protein P3T54_00115 [Dehalogenimonas sp.]|nr:hypothetical protein [Dehalogenimonas sp.]